MRHFLLKYGRGAGNYEEYLIKISKEICTMGANNKLPEPGHGTTRAPESAERIPEEIFIGRSVPSFFSIPKGLADLRPARNYNKNTEWEELKRGAGKTTKGLQDSQQALTQSLDFTPGAIETGQLLEKDRRVLRTFTLPLPSESKYNPVYSYFKIGPASRDAEQETDNQARLGAPLISPPFNGTSA